jgi:hypothetical protein
MAIYNIVPSKKIGLLNSDLTRVSEFLYYYIENNYFGELIVKKVINGLLS